MKKKNLKTQDDSSSSDSNDDDKDNDIFEDETEEPIFSSSQLNLAVQAALKAVGVANSSKSSDTTNFVVRSFSEREKLNSRKNYKQWRRMIELDLKSYDLFECLENEEGDLSWDEKKKRKMKARAQSYLNASVSRNIQASIASASSAYAAMKTINKQYGENETFDCMDLYDRLKTLQFKPGYSQQRYVNDFKELVADFKERDIVLDDAFLRIMFLNKIDGIKDTRSPLSTFYTSMSVQQKENRTLSFVKQQFMNLDLPKEVKSSHSQESNNRGSATNRFQQGKPYVPHSNKFQNKTHYQSNYKQFTHDEIEKYPSKRFKEDSIRHPQSTSSDGRYYKNSILVIPGKRPNYTEEQSATIRKMSPEERRKVQCRNCGQYFHDASACKNPGKQCYRCFNFGHTGDVCPFEKNNPRN